MLQTVMIVVACLLSQALLLALVVMARQVFGGLKSPRRVLGAAVIGETLEFLYGRLPDHGSVVQRFVFFEWTVFVKGHVPGDPPESLLGPARSVKLKAKQLGLPKELTYGALERLYFDSLCHQLGRKVKWGDFNTWRKGLYALPLEIPGMPYYRAIKAKKEDFELLRWCEPMASATASTLSFLAREDCADIDAAIREAMRIRPPVVGAFKRVVGEAVEVHGVRIPKGTKVFNDYRGVCDPDPTFDPGRQRTSFAFGGGACPYEAYAVKQIKVVVAAVLKASHWKLQHRSAWTTTFPSCPRPDNPLLATS